MAIASIIVGVVGLVLSFILGFPLSMFFGPFIGLPIGVVALIFALIAWHGKKDTPARAGLVISIILVALSIVRIISLTACVGRIVGLFAGG